MRNLTWRSDGGVQTRSRNRPHRRLQQVTGGLQQVTRKLEHDTNSYKKIQQVTRGSKRLQQVTRGYRRVIGKYSLRAFK